ncbi:MAG: hypothetical protein JNL11_02520 [Bdellovibrionaceae bacterium]|nr:hypothetical protein [Pseudobdellovibrionaceae bacterium]
MKYISFFIFIFIFNPKAHSQVSCAGAESSISRTADRVKRNFKTGDVSYDVEQIEGLVKRCNINIARFGWGNGIFDYWKNTGYQAEIDTAKEQIEHYSNYRNVDPELQEYRKYASRLKLNTQQINGYYSRYRNQGLTSARREESRCQPATDLRNQALGEVRDQDSIGWCYAFAGADLLTYKLGRKVSAVDLAMNYNSGFINSIYKKFGYGEQDFKGAHFYLWDGVISRTKSKGGACLERNLRSEDNGYTNLMDNLVV